MRLDDSFVRAFIRQAGADLVCSRRLRAIDGTAACQHLHFLQMACEKLAKAYLVWIGSARPGEIESSHAYIASAFPLIAVELYRRAERIGTMQRKRHRNRTGPVRRMNHLAREIELLAPAMGDGGRRSDNSEYPWVQGGEYVAPVDYSFPNLSGLSQPHGVEFLQLIGEAIALIAADLDPPT